MANIFSLTAYYDLNNNILEDGDIIKYVSTINGQDEFVVVTLNPLDIRYRYDINRKYEYSKEDLLAFDQFYGDSNFEIIGNINNIQEKFKLL